MTDPLLAEIEHMIELHKKDGDDDTAFALKWVHKRILEDRERMIKAVDESVGIGVVLFKIRRDEYRKCTMPVISSHRAIAIIRGEEKE